MADVKIEIKNIAEIRRAFDKAPQLMNREMRTALEASAKKVQRDSMLNSPVKTGLLRASHESFVFDSGLQMKAEVGPQVNYGGFVHDGTRFMKGRPFLKQAAEDNVNEIDAYFTRAVQRVFDRIGREV